MYTVINRCIFFLVTLYLTRPSIELDQGQVEFESVYKFVVELRNNSSSMLEYIAKVQIIFCPELPICDREGKEFQLSSSCFILFCSSYCKLQVHKQGQQPTSFWYVIYFIVCMKFDLSAYFRILICPNSSKVFLCL